MLEFVVGRLVVIDFLEGGGGAAPPPPRPATGHALLTMTRLWLLQYYLLAQIVGKYVTAKFSRKLQNCGKHLELQEWWNSENIFLGVL